MYLELNCNTRLKILYVEILHRTWKNTQLIERKVGLNQSPFSTIRIIPFLAAKLTHNILSITSITHHLGSSRPTSGIVHYKFIAYTCY